MISRFTSRFLSTFRVLRAGAFCLATGVIVAAEPVMGEFGQSIQLAPFVVQGKPLTISIHARSKGDRRYAEQFAEEVVKVAYEAVTQETGKGLVIIGKKGEPHPIFLFRQFLALAKEGRLDPAVAACAPELDAMLHHWEHTLEHEAAKPKEDDLEFDQIITALPMPLEGLGAKLYQLAWREDFDPARVAVRWCELHPADLEGNLFAHFDWVFYLPPRGAFEAVVDEIVSGALKEEGAGFFARTFVKGIMLTVKPAIRRAIEGLRHGVMLATVVRARTDFSKAQTDAVMGAYLKAVMSRESGEDGSEHERAVRAVRQAIEDFAKQPAAPAGPAAGADDTAEDPTAI